MQEIILTCDLCKAAEREAKERRRKPSYAVATLDVCAAHHRRYGPKQQKHAGGRRRQHPTVPGESAVERRKRLDRERHQAKREAVFGSVAMKANPPEGRRRRGGSVRKGTEVAPWLERETTVLSLIPSLGRITTTELWRQVQHVAKEKRMRPGAYKKVMQRLKEKGMVAQFGSRKQTKYARANGPVES